MKDKVFFEGIPKITDMVGKYAIDFTSNINTHVFFTKIDGNFPNPVSFLYLSCITQDIAFNSLSPASRRLS